MASMAEVFGDPIFVYTRAQALEDGVLVDVTEWASADKGFIGGFKCPVVMTRALWGRVEAPRGSIQDTRGRAHDVLWLASLTVRRLCREQKETGVFVVRLGRRNETLRVVIDGGGVTIGFPSDF